MLPSSPVSPVVFRGPSHMSGWRNLGRVHGRQTRRTWGYTRNRTDLLARLPSASVGRRRAGRGPTARVANGRTSSKFYNVLYNFDRSDSAAQ
ncbi:Hypothetical protein NTJ_10787 [Nesidiocoris tenuis]|uniref:Uncharacterized protein n=1 Tax=Nesidiocoris tenuis TaxID=355587 RepID=A0ABN7B5D9_9HEMI|nr:Hypothetical protein NTJ_10787 [Nesidiocoris tenuis]